MHWYPATFIPEIPYTLIELLSRPGDRILDPFAGIGTTLWQARALGREAFGCELTLVGHNIASDIWWMLADDTNLAQAQADVAATLSAWDEVDRTDELLATARGRLLEPWFTAGTLRELAYLSAAEDTLARPAARRLFRLAVSGILASVSEQRRGWGCIADNMKPKAVAFEQAPTSRNAIDKVAKRARSIVRTVAATRDRLSPYDEPFQSGDASSHLFAGSCVGSAALSRPDFYDLVVTSPPYPAMVDYSTSQRLSYYWSGVEPDVDTVREIGARRRRFSSRALSDYVLEMSEAMKEIALSVKPGGLIAMVVPAFSTTDGDDPRSTAVQAAMEDIRGPELALRWRKVRLLPASRRHLNQKWTSLQREEILVYERTK